MRKRDGLSFDRPSCWICSEKIAVVGVYIKRIRFSVRREGDVVGIAAGNLHTLGIDVADVRQRNAKLLQHAAQGFGYADLEPAGAAESSGFPGVAGVSGVCAGCSGRCTSRISPVRAAIV